MSSDLVSRALRLVRSVPDDRTTADQLARRLSVHVRTLNLAFRKQYGLTAAAYFRRQRVAVARQLLQTTFASLKEVAALSGLSGSQLNRRLKVEVGMSPSEYRASHFGPSNDDSRPRAIPTLGGRR